MKNSSRIFSAGLALIGIPIVVACGNGNNSCPAGQVTSQYGCLATDGCPANYGHVTNPNRCVNLTDSSQQPVAWNGSSSSCPGYVLTAAGWYPQAGCPAGQGNVSPVGGSPNCQPQVAYNPTQYPGSTYGGYQQPCPVAGANSQANVIWNGTGCVAGVPTNANQCNPQCGTTWNGTSCVPTNTGYPGYQPAYQPYPQQPFYPQQPIYPMPQQQRCSFNSWGMWVCIY